MTAAVTVWPSVTRPAEGHTVSLDSLLTRVREPRTYASKGDPGRWAFATYRTGYRDLAHFDRAYGIALDLDTATTRDQVEAAFSEFFGFAHTTWTAGRWRVALVLDRAVSMQEDAFARVRRAAVAHAERHGLQPEHGQSAAHCFALPAKGGAPYEHVELTGAFFDVGAALAAFPKPEPLPPPSPERTDCYARRLERASKYLATMQGAISGSGGHSATFRAAVALVRGFALEPDDALRLLANEFNPRCAPPWTLPELRHKVRQASERGRLEHGYLADRGGR